MLVVRKTSFACELGWDGQLLTILSPALSIISILTEDDASRGMLIVLVLRVPSYRMCMQ